MKYTFHPHFCSKFQSFRPFWPKIAEIAKSGQKSQHATRSVIWPQIKKCHKMNYTFHPHFYSKFQGSRLFWQKIRDLVSCWLFLAWFGYFGYLWLKWSGTLKFGTKVGVKSRLHFMTFFDLRPNIKGIDFFAPSALVHCNFLRGI